MDTNVINAIDVMVNVMVSVAAFLSAGEMFRTLDFGSVVLSDLLSSYQGSMIDSSIMNDRSIMNGSMIDRLMTDSLTIARWSWAFYAPSLSLSL